MFRLIYFKFDDYNLNKTFLTIAYEYDQNDKEKVWGQIGTISQPDITAKCVTPWKGQF